MSRRFRPLLAIALLAYTAACGHRQANASAQQTALPTMLIDGRGIVMPLQEAVTKIAYRPWIPPRAILKYAVIPPLGNLDTPEHRGIAMEYRYGNTAMLLSEWPKQNFALLFLHDRDISVDPCSIAHYEADGVAWTTRANLAMTLQPDGNVDSKTLEREARALLAAGACR